MIIQSIQSHYTRLREGIRTIEWTTTRDERNQKEYHHSRVYTIRLYTNKAQLVEHNRQSNIDLYS